MHELGELSLIVGDTRSAKQYFQVAMSADGETGQAASNAYTKLDLPENPAKYLVVNPFIDEGRLVATVSNRTRFYISDFKVTYVATVNGKTMKQTITLGPISAGQQVQAESGFRFRQQDSVEQVRVSVTSANF